MFIFEKTGDYEKIGELIKKSNENKRIPLILASRDWQYQKKDFYLNISKAMKKEISEFDLRGAAEKKKDEGQYAKYMKQIKNDLARTLAKGEIFSINVDDTDSKYDEIYDPDLREFYDASVFPS
mmetsp:Transcript_79826/g.110918  ORF Transcript_79826/g.110918 Transcript_79826/m.110918 type:complete len:124 (-) Transcript_79826:114-485(-)